MASPDAARGRAVEDPHAHAAIAVASPNQIRRSIGGPPVDDENLVKLRRIILLQQLVDQPRKHLAIVPYGENH
jgi:hypothetical protein